MVLTIVSKGPDGESVSEVVKRNLWRKAKWDSADLMYRSLQRMQQVVADCSSLLSGLGLENIMTCIWERASVYSYPYGSR